MNCTQCQDTLFDYLENLLAPTDKQALEQHIQDCPACEHMLTEMQAIETRLTQDAQHTALADLEAPVLGAIVRGQKQQLNSTTPLRRSIMKSPLFKSAIAAIIILGCILGFSLFSGTQNIALADVLNKIEQIQAFMYQLNMTITTSGSDRVSQTLDNQEVNATILMSQEYGTKFTMNMGVIGDETMIQEQYVQPQNNRILLVMPNEKRYIEMELNDQLIVQYKEQSRDPRYMIQQLLNCDYEKLGKSEIDGIKVEGFKTTDPSYAGGMGNVEVTVWVATDTWLPIRMDMDITMEGEMSMHMQGSISHFEWDVPVDASAFNPVIPDDYTTIGNTPLKMPEMTEETTITGLRTYATYTNEYPESMSMMAIITSMKKMQDSNTPAAQALKESLKEQGEEAITEILMNTMMPVQAAAGFYARLQKDKKDPAYYGDIVTPDQPDLILMRWKINDTQYKVIFGDLSTDIVDAQGLAILENALPEKDTE